MKLKPVQWTPVAIAFGVIATVGLLSYFQPEEVRRVEWMSYDMRVRQALKYPTPVAANLGFVAIDEATIHYVRTNSAEGFGFGLYWPRQVYGRLVQELTDQGAKVTAFDVIFGDLRSDLKGYQTPDGSVISGDAFLARQLRRAGNVVLALTEDLPMPELFRTNAMVVGNISTEKDADGILRRVKAFTFERSWHKAFLQLAGDPDYGVDLSQARIEPHQIVLRPPPDRKAVGWAAPEEEGQEQPEPIVVPLDAQGRFDLTGFYGDDLPAGLMRWTLPYTNKPVWHMGVVLAAKELGLDLDRAQIDLPHRRITLRGPGVERVLPVDAEGYFYIDWCLPVEHPALTKESAQAVLKQHVRRARAGTNTFNKRWAGKLIVIGSSAVGNDLTDRGATPLSEDSLLVSKHWNVANSILLDRFVRRAPLSLELLLILLMGSLGAVLTLRLRAFHAFGLVLLLIGAYTFVAFALYIQTRYWIPLVLPAGCALSGMHVGLLTWRVFFEQAERRRIKSVFSKMVSPKIVNELLAAETLSLEGARREITVFFADVRGFTELTDKMQDRALETVRQSNLTGAAAEACFAEQARETLSTVNLYLGVVADVIKRQDGTLDKFIGDCVMAFWGAPTSNPQHATACVRAAIEAQRAIHHLNRQRSDENKKREVENQARAAAGLPPQPLLPTLSLGSGINTGLATAGLMGSVAAESLNYTVFGREVNLASRLEGASGRGRVYISEMTYQHLRRDDPVLAATCIELPEPLKLKGFAAAVRVFEVPWRSTETELLAATADPAAERPV